MAKRRRKKGTVVSVDLGNGRTQVGARQKDGHVDVLIDSDGLTATPTVIAFEDGDPKKPVYGQAAVNYRKMRPEYVCVYGKSGRGERNLVGIVDNSGRAWTTGELEALFITAVFASKSTSSASTVYLPVASVQIRASAAGTHTATPSRQVVKRIVDILTEKCMVLLLRDEGRLLGLRIDRADGAPPPGAPEFPYYSSNCKR